MAMKKRPRSRQQELFVQTSALPAAPGHPFYEKLNEILAAHGFDDFVESLCVSYYADKRGRPSIPPGVYFRMIMTGYFEGLGSERGIDWRVADSLTLRQFLGYELTDSTPDHSSLSRIRHRLPVEVHQEVFDWIAKVLAKEGLLKGKTLAVDATTLEANAALRSIVRRDTGEGYDEYLEGLARASGIETPTRQDLVKIDKKRPKKGSNADWEHPEDPDARIAKMKDGRTHLAHKAEHVVDLETQAIVAINVCGADEGDTKSLPWSLLQAHWNLEEVAVDDEARKHLAKQRVAEVVTDKGYHSNDIAKTLQQAGIRGYLSEPDRGRRKWEDDPEAQAAVYANRRRIGGERGKALQRLRAEYAERSFAHTYETGGMRRTHLRGHENIYKRLCIHAGAFNLGLVMRQITGMGTPRGLHGLLAAILATCRLLQGGLCLAGQRLARLCASIRQSIPRPFIRAMRPSPLPKPVISTDC
jgi:transposase|tara:strand:- start:52 stop:1467 length:1416 start_codon:yes stop_codon:yes gene_type:complete